MDELKRQVETEKETQPKPKTEVPAAKSLNELDSPPPPSSPPPYPQTVVTFPTPTSSSSPETGANPRIKDDDHPPVIVGFAPSWKYLASELRLAASSAAKALKMHVKDHDILNKSREESEKLKRGGDYK